MIVFDTSVWIDALKGIKNDKVKLLEEKALLNEIALLPIIIQEILQGIREDEKFNTIKNYMTGFTCIEANQIETAIGAANLFRHLRKNGITIRKPNDCQIAFLCIKYDFKLVHNDVDFNQIAKKTSLKII